MFYSNLILTITFLFKYNVDDNTVINLLGILNQSEYGNNGARTNLFFIWGSKYKNSFIKQAKNKINTSFSSCTWNYRNNLFQRISGTLFFPPSFMIFLLLKLY